MYKFSIEYPDEDKILLLFQLDYDETPIEILVTKNEARRIYDLIYRSFIFDWNRNDSW